MPAKNCLKTYIKDGYYHLYNRGVNKRKIFLDNHDYQSFLYYLKLYLSPPDLILSSSLFAQDGPVQVPVKARRIKTNIAQVTLFGKIELLCYCLMPNHFHLLVKQKEHDAITQLIRRICTAYSMVFNQRRHRVGTLFQGRYKAVLIESEEQFLYLTKYIHRNPLPIAKDRPVQLTDYPYSSLPQYLNHYQTAWLHPQEVLSFFNRKNPQSDYLKFVTEKETEKEVILTYPLYLEE